MSGWRHPDLGRDIDRSRPLPFSFDGRRLQGLAGDTLASALLASGVAVVGRSFKYHRPRGLMAMGVAEPNAIHDVTLDGRSLPNVRATLEPLVAGMALRSVNTAGGAARDRWGVLDLAHRLLPAGFYYKTFMAPGWMRWEPLIRRLAGLGRVDPAWHPPPEAISRHAAPEVMVVGAGPAGLAAAAAAARAGRRVWLIDEAPAPGGSFRWRGGEVDGAGWEVYVADALAAVAAAGGRVLTCASVWGAFDHGLFAVWERGTAGPDTHWRLRPGRTVLATGAVERPLWFANNDLPGVMGAEAALHYLALHGAVAGRRVVLGTAGDPAYPVAGALAAAGVEVTLADARTQTPAAPEGVRLLRGTRIEAARGRGRVRGAVLNGVLHPADAVLMSGGFTPSVQLHGQAGGKLDWDGGRDALLPRPGSAPMIAVGAANGRFDLADALAEGHAAGGGAGAAPRPTESIRWSWAPLRPDPAAAGRIWLDLQNDVTLADVRLAAREGYVSVEHLKRYTTLGMATDQGRSANFAGLAAMAALTGRSIPETGTTTFRPPVQPVPLAVIAGRRRGALFNPPRRLVLEPRHRASGARLREYGGWLRPAVFGTGEEAAVALEEARIARAVAGLYDASPLGKIEVLGPRAAELLDFVGYVRMSTLAPGRARYGFVLSEAGVVIDDGVVLRLAEDRFVVSASSAHVGAIRLALEEARQDRLRNDGVVIIDATGVWATLALTGPAARQVLAAAGVPDLGLAHLGIGESVLAGPDLPGPVPVRIARVSFTGDACFEVSVPATAAEALETRLAAALAEAGGRRIGLEAVMLLRAEKGYVLVGKDTDGLTMPHDLGWGRPRDQRTDEYLGRRALFTPEARRPDRRQLVGLIADDGGGALPPGGHVVAADGGRRSEGFVTSSGPAPGAGGVHALALVEGGRSRAGEPVEVFHLDVRRPARIGPACIFDPAGARLHG
jgi:sarcosine oxidase subunit alpha